MKTLFDSLPLAATDDPISSFEAAERIKSTGLGGQCLQCLEALKRHDGITSKLLAETERLDRIMCARRLPNLRRLGLVQHCSHPCSLICRPDCSLVMYKANPKEILWWIRKEQQ